MRRLILLWLLCKAICPSILADVNRAYDEYGEINGMWYYLYYDDHTAILNDIPDDYSGSIDVPAYVDYDGVKYKVTAIDGGACIRTKITSVTIAEGITSIGWYSFGECPELETVSLPRGLEYIDDCAFATCPKLRSVVLPEGLTHLGAGAFEGCTGLTSVKFPSTLTDINDYAFDYCI